MEEFTIPPPDANPFEPIDVFLYKEEIEDTLEEILKQLPEDEEKVLVLEESCIPIISFFTNLDLFISHNVQKSLIKLSPHFLQTEANIIIYIIRPEIEFISMIEKQMKLNYEEKKAKGGVRDKEYHCIFIPRITSQCHDYLSKSEYEAYLTLHNLNIEVFPLDYDLMSMEEPTSFKDIFIDENFSSLAKLSRIIVNFEDIFGKIKNTYIKGKYAKVLSELVEKDEEVYGIKNEEDILACIYMDRSVDYITPFLTQSIYEGLLDEHFERQYDYIKIPPQILDKPATDPIVKLDISKDNRFYTMIKDYNFTLTTSFLQRRLQLHNEIVKQTKRSNEILDVQKSLTNLSHMKNEANIVHQHIGIASYITNTRNSPTYKLFLTIEQRLLQCEQLDFLKKVFQDEIYRNPDIVQIIKILCIDNLTKGNIDTKVYDELKRDILTVYGNQEIFLLKNLEKLKILKRKPESKIYEFIIEKLKLINLEVNTRTPNDASYVFSAFCPISIRLIEKLLKEGWKANEDILSKLPGPTEFPKNESSVIKPTKDKNIILLVFVGGITFSEIAAIRYINSHNPKYQFIIITTSIINPKSFINQLRFERPKELEIPVDKDGKKEEKSDDDYDYITFRSYYNQVKNL